MRDNAPATPAGDTILVDYDTLRRLAAQLRDLGRHLAIRGAIAQPELDSDLFGKLTSVDDDWSSHRRQLQSFLSETASSVEQIVAAYQKTNDMIASAATSG